MWKKWTRKPVVLPIITIIAVIILLYSIAGIVRAQEFKDMGTGLHFGKCCGCKEAVSALREPGNSNMWQFTLENGDVMRIHDNMVEPSENNKSWYCSGNIDDINERLGRCGLYLPPATS